MNEETEWKSHIFLWKSFVHNDSSILQLKVLNIHSKVLLKFQAAKHGDILCDTVVGMVYVSCDVQSIRHSSHGTIVTVRLDRQSNNSPAKLNLEVDLDDIHLLLSSSISVPQIQMQVGQMILTRIPLSNDIFVLRRVERIEYGDETFSFERKKKTTVLHCSLVDNGAALDVVDSKKEQSSAELAKIVLNDQGGSDEILQYTDSIFGITQITSSYTTLKQRILSASSATHQRQLLEFFFAGEQCRETLETIAAGCHNLSNASKRIHGQYKTYALNILNESSQCSVSSAEINHTDDFVHLFRVIQDMCKIASYFVDLAVVTKDTDKQDSMQQKESNLVQRFQPDVSDATASPQETIVSSSSLLSVAEFTEKQEYFHTVTESVKIIIDAVVVDVTPIMADALSVPFDISTEDWARITHAMCAARGALFALCNTLGMLSSACGSGVSEATGVFLSHSRIFDALHSLDTAMDDYRDRAVLALCESYELSAMDSAHRQEWFSHSAFFRDKKVSHDVLAMSSSVRNATHDLMLQCGTGSVGASDRHSEIVVYTAMQLLLGAQSIALRNYLMLRTSRVRQFQWRLDLCHMLYTAMDSLSQVVRYKQCCGVSSIAQSGEKNERSLTLRQIHVSGESSGAGDSVKVADLGGLLFCSDEVFLWREMLALLLHTALTVIVVTNSSACDVSELLSSLQLVVDSSVEQVSLPLTPPVDSPSCDDIIKDVIDLFKVLLPPSVVDHAFCILPYSSSMRPDFDLTGDIVAYSGYFLPVDSTTEGTSSASLHLSSEEEHKLFAKEQKARVDNPYAGTRAVIFARIAGMLTAPVTRDSDLWRLLRASHVSLAELHSQLSDEEEDVAASTMASLICSLLPRRFEAMECEYPKLNDVQTNNADLIKQFIEKNRV